MLIFARTIVIVALISLSCWVRAQLPDSWLGQEVFYKESAVAKVGTEIFDKSKLPYPAEVAGVNGEWLWLGRAWVRKSDVMTLDEAFNYFDAEVRRNPGSSRCWSGRAACWVRKGELDKAIKDHNEAIRLSPTSAAAFNNRGITRRAQHDYDGAIRDYDAAIRLNPNLAELYVNRGFAKTYLDNLDGAIRDYDEAIRLDPRHALVYINRGWLKHQQHDYDAALQDYDAAIRLNAKEKHAFWNKSFLLATCTDESRRDAKEALRLAEQSLAIAPRAGYAHNAKACALALQGDFDSAVVSEKQALDDPAFAKDEGIDGGKHAQARIDAWSRKTLWIPTSPAGR